MKDTGNIPDTVPLSYLCNLVFEHMVQVAGYDHSQREAAPVVGEVRGDDSPESGLAQDARPGWAGWSLSRQRVNITPEKFGDQN